MNKEECAIGCRVAAERSPNEQGTVLAFTGGGMPVVEWDQHHSVYPCNLDQLIPAHASEQKLAEINAEKSRLEQEFDKVKQDMKTRLDTAANLIRYVNEKLAEHNRSPYHIDDITADFETALQDGGWVPSQSTC